MTASTSAPDPELSERLGLDRDGRPRRWLRWSPWAVLALAAVGAGLVVLGRGEEDIPRFVTEPVRRGDLTVIVTATGELEPLTQVEVGTEISGIIDAVLVDFGDTVRRGDVLARVNTDRLEAQARQARASLQAADAQIAEGRATLDAIETDLLRATIRSPIDGIVLDRQVDPGQTVAASFQTPVLFTLAEGSRPTDVPAAARESRR